MAQFILSNPVEGLADIDLFSANDQTDFQPQADRDAEGKSTVRLTDGKQAYSIKVIAYEKGTDGKQDRQIQNLYVKVFNAPKKLSRFQKIELDGRVVVKPWVNGEGRLGLSINADRVKEEGGK